MNEVVSIITPSFNRASLVTETAESILAQTYPHWEWMIVDDGSTDNSWDVLQELARRDNRIKIFQRDRGPKGACVCRNIAIERSTGTYLIFLDTDDIMAPFCLEQRVKAAQEQPEMDFVVFPMLLFKQTPNDLNLLWNVDKDEDDLMRLLVNDPVCQGTGPLWKKKTFQEIGMWREDLKMWQDVELHIRSLLWPVKFSKRLDLRPDVYLRISDDSMSRVGFHSPAKIRSRVEVLQYTCETLQKKNLLSAYHRGLREMAWNIVMEMVFQNLASEGLQLLHALKPFEVFSEEEYRHLRNFAWVRRTKLYKFKKLDQLFYNRANAFGPKLHTTTIGHIRYQSTLQPAL